MNETIAALGPWFHNLHLPDGEPREELAWIEDELRAATGRPVPRLMS